MCHKAIREYDGKRLLAQLMSKYSDEACVIDDRHIKICLGDDFEQIARENPWVRETTLVAKPDQLIKRRGNNNLILLNASWEDTVQWIAERQNSVVTLDDISGSLHTFIVEPFIPHKEEDEYYLCIRTARDGDEILFHSQGGVKVGDVDAKATRLFVNVLESLNKKTVTETLLGDIPEERRNAVAEFIRATYLIYCDANFTYLEINPLTFVNGTIVPLDLAAKLDNTAEFESGQLWDGIDFPEPFGREATPEEEYIRSLDEKSGASLKFTLLEPKGRVWTMLAGGGASVIYSDTIADLGFGRELANYGEYSGNPTDDETYEYAKTVLDLMTREGDSEGREKVLIIGGGIANFTDVAATFKGIGKALSEYKTKLNAVNARVFVRRGGPNFKEGLKNMQELGEKINVPIQVFGPETHMTRIVRMALA